MFKIATAALAAISALALAPSADAASSAGTHNYVVYVQHCNQRGYALSDYTPLPVHRTENGAFARALQVAENWKARQVEIHDLSGRWVAHYDTLRDIGGC